MKQPKPPAVQRLSIFLLKPECGAPESFLQDPGALKWHSVPVGAFTGKLYTKDNHFTPAAWTKFFRPALALTLNNASTSAILHLQTAGRDWALAFGFGRHLLLPGCVEPDFGLTATLSLVIEVTPAKTSAAAA